MYNRKIFLTFLTVILIAFTFTCCFYTDIHASSQNTKGKIHSGTISPMGEVWRKSDSPHIVRGVFQVRDKKSPVLTIEPGAQVVFEKNARIEIGKDFPGSIVAKGEISKEIIFTANSVQKSSGYWGGIWFFENAVPNKSIIKSSIIEYGGAKDKGSIFLNSVDNPIEVKLIDVQIRNSVYSGVNIKGNSCLSKDSSNLKITGTKAVSSAGGFPIITDSVGSNFLPSGTFESNAANSVSLTSSSDDLVISNTTVWRNIGIPYTINTNVRIDGPSNPMLIIEPGVNTLWAKDSSLIIEDPEISPLAVENVSTSGTLLWISRPEGGGEWITRPEGGGEWLWVSKPEGGGEWYSEPVLDDPLMWETKPENDGEWLWISRPEGGGEWITRPEGGGEWLWISKPEGGGEWITRPEGDEWLWISKPEGGGEWKAPSTSIVNTGLSSLSPLNNYKSGFKLIKAESTFQDLCKL